MGSAWLGLLGALIGGLVSLTGTLVTTRLQWRQERARWNEQRERDLIQWTQQRQSDAEKLEGERHRETAAWERDRYDEHLRWLREQKLKYYLEATDHLRAASALSSSSSYAREDEKRPYAREGELAIAQELKQGYGLMKSLMLVCRKDAAAKVDELSRELYFTIQVVINEGMKPGEMVRRTPGKQPSEWILSELIDTMSAKLAEILREDLHPNHSGRSKNLG